MTSPPAGPVGINRMGIGWDIQKLKFGSNWNITVITISFFMAKQRPHFHLPAAGHTPVKATSCP